MGPGEKRDNINRTIIIIVVVLVLVLLVVIIVVIMIKRKSKLKKCITVILGIDDPLLQPRFS